MRTAVVIHKGGDHLGFVCQVCFNDKKHKRFAKCEIHHSPQRCEVCKRWIGWEEDRKMTPTYFMAVRPAQKTG